MVQMRPPDQCPNLILWTGVGSRFARRSKNASVASPTLQSAAVTPGSKIRLLCRPYIRTVSRGMTLEKNA
jgi:hypothetical protein